jgi:hypothetical protein
MKVIFNSVLKQKDSANKQKSIPANRKYKLKRRANKDPLDLPGVGSGAWEE